MFMLAVMYRVPFIGHYTLFLLYSTIVLHWHACLDSAQGSADLLDANVLHFNQPDLSQQIRNTLYVKLQGMQSAERLLAGIDYLASKLYKILMSKGIEDTGKFWHREGQELPW